MIPYRARRSLLGLHVSRSCLVSARPPDAGCEAVPNCPAIPLTTFLVLGLPSEAEGHV